MTKKYSLGFVGRKAGMSRVFTEDGQAIPVTLIEATPNRIAQIKTVEADGYSAVQVTVGARRAALVNKPEAVTSPRRRSTRAVACGNSALKTPSSAISPSVAKSRRTSLKSARSSTSRVSPRVRASRAPSSATTSVWVTLPTATRCRIARRVRWVSARRQVACSRARRCPVTWARCSRAPRTWKLSRSTSSAV